MLTRPVNDRDFDVALHIVFDSQEAHDAYQDAPSHQHFISENKPNWKLVRVFDADIESMPDPAEEAGGAVDRWRNASIDGFARHQGLGFASRLLDAALCAAQITSRANVLFRSRSATNLDTGCRVGIDFSQRLNRKLANRLLSI